MTLLLCRMFFIFRGVRGYNEVKWLKKLEPKTTMFQPQYGNVRPKFWGHPGPSNSFRSPFMPPRSPRPMLPSRGPTFGPNIYGAHTMVNEPRVRTVKCGELRNSDCGIDVEIAGRVQNLRMNRFIILRDDTGITQLVAPDERIDLQKKLGKMPLDSYIRVRGQVILRPENSWNDTMATGDIEVLIQEFVTIQHKRKLDYEDDGGTSKSKKPKPGGMKLTTEEVAKAETLAMRSYFTARSTTCGDLTSASKAGDEISLCGWVLTIRPPLFVVLKDGHGEVQLVSSSTKLHVGHRLKHLNRGDVIFVKGILATRPFGQGNPRIPNGLIEVAVNELTVVDKHSPNCEEELTKAPVREVSAPEDPVEFPPPETAETNSAWLNRYTHRTHTCGELRGSDVGMTVTLMGWVEFVRLTKFLTLRDAYGNTQILISDSDIENNKLLGNLSLESALKVTGTVCSRPSSQIKEDLLTGEIEVLASTIEVLNEVKTQLPFSIREFKKAKESLRMEHRYLDLRFKEMQNNLRLRSKILMKMREFLIHQCGFVEIETPTLFKRTPGGAREFVVPTHQAGLFYSLVQSPQQLKQLLMVGSMDRYFQVARCYRDETTRPDRQPEFTQLDIELSFCGEDEVMKLVEDLLQKCWPDGTQINTPFQRLTYEEAMESYGSDKPDLRYDWKMVNLTEEFNSYEDIKLPLSDVKELLGKEDFGVYGIVADKGGAIYTTSVKKNTEEKLKKDFPLTTMLLLSNKTIEDRLQTIFGDAFATAVTSKMAIKSDSAVFIALGSKNEARECVGKFREFWAEQMEQRGLTVRNKNPNNLKFLWVTDFPLFSKDDNGKLQSNHHPFTAPKKEHSSILFDDPLKVSGLHYDLVLNGSEVGGGSIRIHDGYIQEKVLTDILKLHTDSLSHLLTALKFGAPPHGGIALGVDRLIATMVGAHSIRDVIAFPKGTDGKDPMTGAPSLLNFDEINYYHLNKK